MISNAIKVTLLTLLTMSITSLQSCSDDDDNPPSESQETIISYKIDGQYFEYTNDDIVWTSLENDSAISVKVGNRENGLVFAYLLDSDECGNQKLYTFDIFMDSTYLYRGNLTQCIELNSNSKLKANFTGTMYSGFVEHDSSEVVTHEVAEGKININFEDIQLDNDGN